MNPEKGELQNRNSLKALGRQASAVSLQLQGAPPQPHGRPLLSQGVPPPKTRQRGDMKPSPVAYIGTALQGGP